MLPGPVSNSIVHPMYDTDSTAPSKRKALSVLTSATYFTIVRLQNRFGTEAIPQARNQPPKTRRLTMSDPQQILRDFQPNKSFFVGIDSDGCVFDSMEVKHKDCFIPRFVQYFELAGIAKYARETWEFVNLYSKGRGMNRFPGLVKTIDLLSERPEVKKRGFEPPALTETRAWLDRETKLANPTLKKLVEETGDPELQNLYDWSLAVNQLVDEIVHDVPPFPYVRECLEFLQDKADVMVVSATPLAALEKEWKEHGIDGLVGVIAGQEQGTKKEHLQLAAGPERYARDHVLMIGDAPGDRKAAESAGVLFYPIDPGHEDASWERLYKDALPRFFAGTYAGAYMAERIAEFEALLPETPHWKTSQA
jgi:phosphoglycolate phosphatase-like HAD superfamily hydrolase